MKMSIRRCMKGRKEMKNLLRIYVNGNQKSGNWRGEQIVTKVDIIIELYL